MSRAPRSAAARRNWGSDDSGTPIIHVDMDAFFVSVELLDKPNLRGLPVAVGGQGRGVISAASYEARAFGVNSAMPVARAKRLCPHLIILPARTEQYRAVSVRIMDILRSITPKVEQLSVDEAFLDVAGARVLFGSPVEIGRYIRAEIRAREGVPASVGIANTKHVAKLASSHAKPDGMLLVPADQSLAFLYSLPVGALWGVGEKSQELFERKGVETVGDLAELGEAALMRMFGSRNGAKLYALALNRDSSAVTPERSEKSMSSERTFFEPLRSFAAVEKEVLAQSQAVGARLRAEGVKAKTVSVKLRSADFVTVQRSFTLAAPIHSNAALYTAALELLRSLSFPESGVRLVGVRASNLVAGCGGEQLSLLELNDGVGWRSEKMDEVIDAVRERFGEDAVGPGSLI